MQGRQERGNGRKEMESKRRGKGGEETKWTIGAIDKYGLHCYGEEIRR